MLFCPLADKEFRLYPNAFSRCFSQKNTPNTVFGKESRVRGVLFCSLQEQQDPFGQKGAERGEKGDGSETLALQGEDESDRKTDKA